MGRIERGGGDGGEPARSPLGRPRFRRLRDRACGCDICRCAEGTVIVLKDGFDWQGRKFKSLSAVARAITGTRWNGYRFFGLRERKREEA